MTRAEERALEAYPDFKGKNVTVVQGFQRQCYMQGYEQAEKDLALTWKDIESIIHIYESSKDIIGDYDVELYEEILKRYWEKKK